MLDTYFQQSPIPAHEPAEGVEVSVEADLGTTKLVGIIEEMEGNLEEPLSPSLLAKD